MYEKGNLKVERMKLFLIQIDANPHFGNIEGFFFFRNSREPAVSSCMGSRLATSRRIEVENNL